MEMPYNLQKLPPEALQVLSYLRSNESASLEQVEEGTGLSSRAVGRAIRRLVTSGQIEMYDRIYYLTQDGQIAARQLAEYEAATAPGAGTAEEAAAPLICIRRLVVVIPRSLPAKVATAMYIGVNPPATGVKLLPGRVPLELRVSAVGGMLSQYQLSLEVPPDRAAVPGKVGLTPAQPGHRVRVRVDAFQIHGLDNAEPLGGMYFDVKVPLQAEMADPSVRAVGMDLLLKANSRR